MKAVEGLFFVVNISTGAVDEMANKYFFRFTECKPYKLYRPFILNYQKTTAEDITQVRQD